MSGVYISILSVRCTCLYPVCLVYTTLSCMSGVHVSILSVWCTCLYPVCLSVWCTCLYPVCLSGVHVSVCLSVWSTCLYPVCLGVHVSILSGCLSSLFRIKIAGLASPPLLFDCFQVGTCGGGGGSMCKKCAFRCLA